MAERWIARRAKTAGSRAPALIVMSAHTNQSVATTACTRFAAEMKMRSNPRCSAFFLEANFEHPSVRQRDQSLARCVVGDQGDGAGGLSANHTVIRAEFLEVLVRKA